MTDLSNITATIVAARRVSTGCGVVITGLVFGDRSGRAADGDKIITSVVKRMDGPIAHTRSSVYYVTWASDGRSA